jgi:hypothetical protein
MAGGHAIVFDDVIVRRPSAAFRSSIIGRARLAPIFPT